MSIGAICDVWDFAMTPEQKVVALILADNCNEENLVISRKVNLENQFVDLDWLNKSGLCMVDFIDIFSLFIRCGLLELCGQEYLENEYVPIYRLNTQKGW